MHLRKVYPHLLIALLALLISACGGSGRTGDSDQQQNDASATGSSAEMVELAEQTPRDQQVVFYDEQGDPLQGVPEGVTVERTDDSFTINLTEDREFVYALVRNPRVELAPELETEGLTDDFTHAQETTPGNTVVALQTFPENRLDAGSSASLKYTERPENSTEKTTSQASIPFEFKGDFTGVRRNLSAQQTEFVEGLNGDSTGDHTIDLGDISPIFNKFGSQQGDPQFSELEDYSNDDVLDLSDVSHVFANFGVQIEGYEIRQGNSNPPTANTAQIDYDNPSGGLAFNSSTDSIGRVLLGFVPPQGSVSSSPRYLQVVPIVDGSPQMSLASDVLDLFTHTQNFFITVDSPSLSTQGSAPPPAGDIDNRYLFDPSMDFPIQFKAYESSAMNTEITSQVNWALYPQVLASGSGNGFSGSTAGLLQGISPPDFGSITVMAYKDDQDSSTDFNIFTVNDIPFPENFSEVSQSLWLENDASSPPQ